MSFLLGLLVGTEVTILTFLEKQIDSRNNLYLELKALLEFRHFFFSAFEGLYLLQ